MAKKVAQPARKPAAKKAAAKKPAARKGAPKAKASTPPQIPMRNVTGQLVVSPAKDAIEWYKRVFAAKELIRQADPKGNILHCQLQLGDTNFMVADAYAQPPAELAGAYLHIHHKDAQTMWGRAVAGGAKVVLPFAPQFWGDLYGQMRDPFGQLWSLSWTANLSEAEKKRLQAQAFAQGPPKA